MADNIKEMLSSKVDHKEHVARVAEMARRNIILILLVLFILLPYLVAPTFPYIVHRMATRVFTYYEIYKLKYPHSDLIERETMATSKVTMATDYTYHTNDDLEDVREYLERRRPGFIHVIGSLVVSEPTFSNTVYVEETVFKNIFQLLGKGTPWIEVYIYPSTEGGTAIRISENWHSMGFPAWLRMW